MIRRPRYDVTAVFLRAIENPEMELSEFRQAVRGMNRYAPCEFTSCRGIAELWIGHLGGSGDNSNDTDHHGHNPLCLLRDHHQQQPFSDSLLLTMEKTRCIFLESDALQQPFGGSSQAPLPLLHTMLHWGVPNFLIYLVAQIYPQELHMRHGKSPLRIVADWAGTQDMAFAWRDLEKAFWSYCTVAPISTSVETTSKDNYQGPEEGRSFQPTVLELIMKRKTPIALLSHLMSTFRSAEDESNDISSSLQLAPAVESFLHGMAHKGRAWICYRNSPYSGRGASNSNETFQMTNELLGDLECLIKLAPSALARAKIPFRTQEHDNEVEEWLPACMVPATYDDRPFVGYDDEAHNVLVLNLIYFTLHQDPSVALASTSC